MQRSVFKTLAAMLGLIAIIALFSFKGSDTSAISQFEKTMAAKPPFTQQITLYRDLMKKVGAVKGQDVLLQIMPNDSLTHMLNHETGRYLYETEGFAGVQKCTTAFADSCYHGFISGVVLDRGLGDLNALLDACKKGTQRDQELQCAHGMGHGFLEDVGYKDLPKALDLCEKTFSSDQKDAGHCYEGVFMENNFGAFNAAPADRWVKTDDAMYPCNEPFVLDKPGAHEFCWFMQSQSTLRGVQYGSLGSVQKVSAYCDAMKDGSDKDICFMGLARQIQLNNANDVTKMRENCALLPKDRQAQCIWDGAQAAYIYGERDSSLFKLCDSATNKRDIDACYHTLFQAIGISYSEDRDRLAACSVIQSNVYQSTCASWVASAEAKNF